MRLSALPLLSALALSALLIGCTSSVGRPTGAAELDVNVTGHVHGGQQPISGATIQLYTVGTTGAGSASTPLLTKSVITDANGNFNITGLYSCSQASLVYITSIGGNPGLSTTNPNIAEMTALGPCSNLTSNTFINIDELTTVAATATLAPYASSSTAIGSLPGASSLSDAFTLAGELVSTTSGLAPGSGVPVGFTVPVTQIDTLGNIISSCINSAGGTATGTTCGNLFSLTTPVGGAAPTDTIQALFNLANNPSLNTAALFNLAPPNPPFQPQLTSAPADFATRLMPAAGTPALTISPSNIAFPSTVVSFASQPLAVTLTNSTTNTYNLQYPSLTGVNASDFGISSPCSSVFPGSSCQSFVTFQPKTPGVRNAVLIYTATVNASGQQQTFTIPLTGQGLNPTGGPATFSQSSLTYSISGSLQDVQLQNFGSTPIPIRSISTDSTHFSVESNTCGTMLLAQSVCTISVAGNGLSVNGITYATYTGNLVVDDGASTGPQKLPLSSTNIVEFGITPRDFGTWPVGSTHTSSLTYDSGSYYNSASLGLSVSGTDASDFSVTPSSCTVQGGVSPSTCTIPLTFTPTAPGARTAKLLLSTNGSAGGVQYARLTGTANPAGPSFTVTPNSVLNGGAVLSTAGSAVGTSSYTILNNGSTTLTLSSAVSGSSAANYAPSSNCSNIAPDQTCTVTVTFSGRSIGTFSATLTVKDNLSGFSQTVPLATQVVYPTPVPSPTFFSFGSVPVNTSSAARSFTVTSGTYGATLEEPVTATITNGANAFSLPGGSSCPASTTQTCTLTVAFNPAAIGTFSGTITLTGQISGYQASISLSGSSDLPGISYSPTSVTFPGRPVNTTSVPMTITVTSSGKSALNIKSIGFPYSDPTFTQTNNCPASLQPGATCTISASFSPMTAGYKNINLVITSNAPSSPDIITLYGTASN